MRATLMSGIRAAGAAAGRPLWLSLPAVLLVSTALAAPGTASGSGGLALSALVAANSPTVSAGDKKVLAALLAGQANASYPAGKKISIAADSITCAAGNVDITLHSCKLVFGKKTVTLTGRQAHEIYATLVEAEVPSDGALGTIYETLTHLACTVDPGEVKQKAGEGVSCKFETGGP
jgi:hypothetical protein